MFSEPGATRLRLYLPSMDILACSRRRVPWCHVPVTHHLRKLVGQDRLANGRSTKPAVSLLSICRP